MTNVEIVDEAEPEKPYAERREHAYALIQLAVRGGAELDVDGLAHIGRRAAIDYTDVELEVARLYEEGRLMYDGLCYLHTERLL